MPYVLGHRDLLYPRDPEMAEPFGPPGGYDVRGIRWSSSPRAASARRPTSIPKRREHLSRTDPRARDTAAARPGTPWPRGGRGTPRPRP